MVADDTIPIITIVQPTTDDNHFLEKAFCTYTASPALLGYLLESSEYEKALKLTITADTRKANGVKLPLRREISAIKTYIPAPIIVPMP